MKTRIARSFSLMLALAAMPLVAMATPVVVGEPVLFEGHYYVIVKHNGTSWDAAKAFADSQSYRGAQGHLATLTSAAEDNFVNNLRAAAFLAGSLNRAEVWIGGSQANGENCATCNWNWENGEGAISGTSSAAPYANWQFGEPNDNYGVGSEQRAALGLGNNPGWNDEGSTGNIGGFVIEYGAATSAPVSNCQNTPEGCPLAGGGIKVQPPQTITGGDTISSTTRFEIDPRVANGTCGLEPLVLYADDPEGRVLTIPEYYCAADPDGLFVVLHLDSNVTVTDGVVDAITDPEIYFGDAALDCNIPVPVDVDPTQWQDEQVYQPSDPADISEGHAIGTISDCGTGRGKTKGLSYFAVGMHTVCPTDVSGNRRAAIRCQADLTKAKLHGMLASILDSKNAVHRRDFNKFVVLGGLANLAFHFGLYDIASHKLGLLINEVEGASFDPGIAGNPRGDILMRAYHIKFITDVRIIGPLRD